MKQSTYWRINNLIDYVQSAFFVMLALGGLSHYLNQPKLAIGYIPSLLIMVVIREAMPWGVYHPQILSIDKKNKDITF